MPEPVADFTQLPTTSDVSKSNKSSTFQHQLGPPQGIFRSGVTYVTHLWGGSVSKYSYYVINNIMYDTAVCTIYYIVFIYALITAYT